MSTSDASPAYRGYRLQALYVLDRILAAANAHLVFQPEGTEDLAVLGAGDSLLETVQVKALSHDLALSSFEPDKPDSFFYRAAKVVESAPGSQVSIATFGPVGPEMQGALSTAGTERNGVIRKLSGYGFISESQARSLLTRIRLVQVDEGNLTARVYAALANSLTGVEPDRAFELLSYWLYIHSERKERITRDSVIQRLVAVGRFLSERAAYHAEWFTSILPIEDHDVAPEEFERLANEFYLGVSARYDHILANLAVERPEKTRQIAKGFDSNRVVIVHGASGQGKTTLALHYLRDALPSIWRFKIEAVRSAEHALRIAAALEGHARAIGLPVVVYMDVSPKDSNWPDLVKRLAGFGNVRVLVTVREEDFRRASISGAELPFQEVELDFSEDEARAIYDSLAARRAPSHLLGFDEAWARFRGEGPLMEFVHLVTQGDSLRQRLAQQVARLQDEARAGKIQPSELSFLRLVSVASAFEARIRLEPLVSSLGLVAPERVLEVLEREYLIRVSPDRSLVQGLHPIRSAILADLLTDPVLLPWSQVAQECLPYLHEADIESFLLCSFSRHRPKASDLLEALDVFQPQTWAGIGGTVRALIWFGLSEYVQENSALLEEARFNFAEAGTLILGADISGAIEETESSWWTELGDLIPKERRQLIEGLRARQTDKRMIFRQAAAWLSKLTRKPAEPNPDSDWEGLAQVLFWAARLGVKLPISEWVNLDEIDKAIPDLPIGILADLMVGMAAGYDGEYGPWLEVNRMALIRRFQRDTETLLVEDDGNKLTAHFAVQLVNAVPGRSSAEQASGTASNPLHDEAVTRVNLLRRLLADRELYACQGYGHRLWTTDLPVDDTMKTGIPRSKLPLFWLTSINSTFRGLAELPLRTATWEDYAKQVLTLREATLDALAQIERAVQVFFARRGPTNVIGDLVDSDLWERWEQKLNGPPLFPLCSVDEWGFIDESFSASAALPVAASSHVDLARGLAIQTYKGFSSALRQYTRSLSLFSSQSPHALVLSPTLGRQVRSVAAKRDVLRAATREGVRQDVIHLSVFNLADAVSALPSLQAHFRRLFGQYLQTSALDSLDTRERKMFHTLWCEWHCFATQPNLVLYNAPGQCSKRLSDLVSRMRRSVLREFDGISSTDLTVRILSEKVYWGELPCLWVAVDGSRAEDVYGSVGRVVAAIHRSIVQIEDSELRYFAISFSWPHVAVIPLVRGKMLGNVAWRFSLPIMMSKEKIEELGWWNFAPQPVPSDALRELGVNCWDLREMVPATKLLASSSELSQLTAHLRDFRNLPELDDYGITVLQTHIERITPQLNGALQTILDVTAQMADAFNQLSFAEQSERPELVSALQSVAQLHRAVTSVTELRGETKIGLEEIFRWADQLEDGQKYAVLAYLFWSSDAITRVA